MAALTDADVANMIGEGFHTAFRKATDCPQAHEIWKLIQQMPATEWSLVVEFVADPLISAIKSEGLV